MGRLFQQVLPEKWLIRNVQEFKRRSSRERRKGREGAKTQMQVIAQERQETGLAGSVLVDHFEETGLYPVSNGEQMKDFKQRSELSTWLLPISNVFQVKAQDSFRNLGGP